jgi:ABC-type sugar transport system ATPase subunit
VAEPAVRFEGITKRFPGALALADVSVAVESGSCHALCGENGAGKSTLGKILAGIHPPDAGRLFIRGREVSFGSPRDAMKAGVGMVHQELAFCENLSVADNLCLGSLPSRHGLVSRKETEQRAAAMLDEIGMSLDVGAPVGGLSIAQQQMVQIAQAVGGGAGIIVFDEPTSSLSQAETEQLFGLFGRLRSRGVTCIYVSHRMTEVFRLCDAVTVLRDGRLVVTAPTASLTEAELVRLMIGRPLAEYFPRQAESSAGDELLRVEGLSSPGRFTDISFSLRAGEVVGLAGLVGAGRSELAGALFGLPPAPAGAIRVRGAAVHIRGPRDAIRLGLGLVPEDRKRQGIVAQESGLHNISLPVLKRLSRFSWLRTRKERSLAGRFLDRLSIRASALDAAAAGLSGGNQQKIVLARWLAAGAGILILDEPTRGVDVAAKAEIHALIGELAAQGAGILLISSELPEVLSLSDRILVLRAGKLVGDVSRERASQDGVLRMMAGLEASVPR